eukprot:5553409-Prorocentrum_lima.AAC.1
MGCLVCFQPLNGHGEQQGKGGLQRRLSFFRRLPVCGVAFACTTTTISIETLARREDSPLP